jgi:Ca2+-binding EF-hand superfamily protein
MEDKMKKTMLTVLAATILFIASATAIEPLNKYDVNENGVVNSQDLLYYRFNVLNKYDLNKDGSVDFSDMIEVRKHYGSEDLKYDLNKNGVVNSQDVLFLQNIIKGNDLNNDSICNTKDLTAIHSFILKR